MSRMREEEVARTLAMVMTERLHPEFMTCREVVATGRYPYTGRLGILSAEDWKLVDDAMQLVHARDTADRNFSQISDGQRQRVMLARAICQEPRILILDEPTSYLDMRYKIDILSSIRRLAAERNMAVVMSLHELDLALKVSDVIACVEGDHIGKTGTPEEVFSGDYIQKAFRLLVWRHHRVHQEGQTPETQEQHQGHASGIYRDLAEYFEEKPCGTPL